MKQGNLIKLNQKIQEIAKSYTKEWKLDYEQPDVGAVFAKIFSGMMYETNEKFSKVMESHKDIFLQILDVKDQSAADAGSVVVFESNLGKKETAPVPAGTKLIAKSPKGETIYFETMASLYAGGGEITTVFTVQEALDKIYIVYSKDKEEALEDIPVFWIPPDKNDNRHVLYLSQPVLFRQSGKNTLYIKFEIAGDAKELAAAEALFADADWQYYSKEGEFKNFFKKRFSKGIVELSFAEGEETAPVSNESEEEVLQEGYCIRAVFNSSPEKIYPKLTAESVTLRAQSSFMPPSVLYFDDVQIMHHAFAPYGENFHLYSEFFIGEDTVFSKAGSLITLQFVLSFQTFVQKVELPEMEIEWKTIMKKPKVIKQVEKDVYLEEVVWEYFNGRGYARLKTKMNYEGIFDARGYQEDKNTVTIEFVCPSDWEPAMVKAHTGFFLRARILRAQNIYHMPSVFYSPVIDEMKLAYCYPDFSQMPSAILLKHHLDTVLLPGDCRKVPVYEPLSGRYQYQYFVLDYIGTSPISFYFKLENKRKENHRLYWEYGTEAGFDPIEVMDETEHFQHSGIISFPKMEGISKKKLYGMEGYFLRVTRRDREECLTEKFPVITVKKIYKNAVTVIQQETMPDEYFFVEESRPFFQITLLKANCRKVSVYINEMNGLSEREVLDLYMGERETVAERDSSGNIKNLFVKWEEREDFQDADALSRVYVLDKKRGIITFGDGNKGRMPPVSKHRVVLVRYKTGRGSEGNADIGEINRSAYFLKGIKKIFNPEKAIGGCSYRSVEEERDMSISYLNHFNRLITWDDMEHLAKEAVRGIAGVKAGSYFDEKGEKVPGKILLTVLHQDYKKGKEAFLAVKDNICNSLLKRCDGCMGREQIVIEEPQFFRYNIQLWVKSQAEENRSDLEKQIIGSLSAFLDPVTGGFLEKGWEIGRYPTRQQILNYLRFQKFPVSIIDIYISITRVTFADSMQEEKQEAYRNQGKSDYEYESLKLWKNQVLVGLSGIHKLVWV